MSRRSKQPLTRRGLAGRRAPAGEDYQVGYGKPPAGHRFKSGQSGNPAGSRRRSEKKGGAKNLKAELIDALLQKMPVTENGRRRRLPRQTVLIRKLITDALAGDPKARDQLLRLAHQSEVRGEPNQVEDLVGAARDAEILAGFRADIIEQHVRRRK